MVRQLPVRIRATHKSDVRSQVAALCYRVENGKTRLLLITSRRQRRWILPKGWPIDNQTPAQSALQEAWEEAGVIGRPVEQCIGVFSYTKARENDENLPCMVMVYPIEVTEMRAKFPEKGQRRRKWFKPKNAAARVSEPELAKMLKEFDPSNY